MFRPKLAFALRLLAALIIYFAVQLPVPSAAQVENDWAQDWSVRSGFSIELVLEGVWFPTAIAFVPEPGPDPGDPAFFIAELSGAIKVVTNEGELLTFAEDFFERFDEETYPPGEGETGLSSVCLAPEHGYVYVTYAYYHEDGQIRNNVGRFDTVPGQFSIAPTDFQDFERVFLGDESRQSHQIGSCQVDGDNLYVGVGDAFQSWMSTDLDSTLGKVLRMTLDGRPIATNPFFVDDSQLNPRNYIWASGFRNPFGVRVIRDQLFVADNGYAIDRLLRVEGGRDYLWDGTDDSIGAAADLLVPDGRGVGQFDAYRGELGFFPDSYANSIFLVATGDANDPQQSPRILDFEYSFTAGRVTSVPQPFLEYRGQGSQVLAFANFGPDGLYFAPLIPHGGIGRLFRIVHQSSQGTSNQIEEQNDPAAILRRNGCTGCHSLSPAEVSGVGPSLRPDVLVDRLRARLNSEEYEQSLAAVEQLNSVPFVDYREARAEVLRADDLDRVRVWLAYKLQEPRFDNPGSRMPTPDLTAAEISALVDYFVADAQSEAPGGEEMTELEEGGSPDVGDTDALPSSAMGRQTAYAAVAGLIVGWVTLGGVYLLARSRRRNQTGSRG